MSGMRIVTLRSHMDWRHCNVWSISFCNDSIFLWQTIFYGEKNNINASERSRRAAGVNKQSTFQCTRSLHRRFSASPSPCCTAQPQWARWSLSSWLKIHSRGNVWRAQTCADKTTASHCGSHRNVMHIPEGKISWQTVHWKRKTSLYHEY